MSNWNFSQQATRQVSPPQLTFNRLQAAETHEEHLLHQVALEWGLADPIVIDSVEDIKSRVSWQDRLEPFHHQMQNLMTFCRRLPVTLIADDVGLGKTISAGLVLSELMIRNRVSRTLVICPSILGPQWVEELGAKFGISGRFATGAALKAELKSDAPVVVTTYHSASPRLSSIEPGAFDMLILDEAHKLRNLHGAQKPPQMALNIRTALKDRLFRYVLMLTATPIQNRLWDLYSLVDCLAVAKGHRNPFGSPTNFAQRFIDDAPTSARVLNRDTREEFRKILRQYLVRTRRMDVHLAFPQREIKLLRIIANDLDRHLFRMASTYLEGLNPLLQISLLMAMMSSPQALIAQLRNMAEKDRNVDGTGTPIGGATRRLTSPWARLADEVDSLVRQFPLSSKIQGLLGLIDRLARERPADWRLVIFTTRKETQAVIGRALKDRGIPYGFIQGGQPHQNTQTVANYSAAPPQIHVIVSTDAGAEGVNLQKGNVLVNFDLPWNPMIVEQRIGRVQRLASSHRQVVIFNLAVAGSFEERVVARLLEKLQTISDSVGDIEAVLEATSGDGDASSDKFEMQVLDLVRKSLAGQDVQQATELAVKSIDEAKKLFEAQREEIDRTLGHLDELHQSGPPMPRLTPSTPAMPYPQFVHAALAREGAEIHEGDNSVHLVKWPGLPQEYITFDERAWRQWGQTGVFHGKRPKLYAPGKTDFERLIQRWMDRAGHYTKDLTGQTATLAKDVIAQWCSEIPQAAVQRVHFSQNRRHVQGQCHFKVKISNAVDSYEKLLTTPIFPTDHGPVREIEGIAIKQVDEEVVPDRMAPEVAADAKTLCQEDPDVQQFCDFYHARLEEELDKAGDQLDLRKKVESDLRPHVHAQAVGFSGVLYESCDVDVAFSIGGEGSYTVRLTISPATGQIHVGPEGWFTCRKSEGRYPIECASLCEYSGAMVLTHLTVVSDESGRRALQEYSQRCERTGKITLIDEFATSDYSGIRVAASALRRSEISDRRGLPEEIAECEFTDSAVLLDELFISDVSGNKYRNDQSLQSAVSGLRGHQSEFETCEATGVPMTPVESARSDLSNKRVRSDILVSSQKPPHRRGTSDEVVKCAVTGALLLKDEVAECQATGATVDRELLIQSAVSQRLAQRDVMVTCSATGQVVLPDETAVSVISGRRCLQSLTAASTVSERIALKEELQCCDITGELLFPDEVDRCSVTRKVVDRRLLKESDVSGERALASEMDHCAVTGKFARKSELSSCEFTSASVLPGSLITSSVSGKRFRDDQSITSFLTGQLRTAHESECIVSSTTGEQVLADEAHPSDYSGRVDSIDGLGVSDVSLRLGLKEEITICEESGIQLLPDEWEVSAFSGKRVDRRILVESCTGRLGLPSEMLTCEVTGKPILLDEVVVSDISGRKFLNRLAVKSPVSGRVALPQELCRCEVSEALLFPDELATCVGTGMTVDRRLLHRSDVSGACALPESMAHCVVSGQYVLKSELAKCEMTSAAVLPERLLTSSISGKRFREDQCVTSTLTGQQRVGHTSECLISESSRDRLLSDETYPSDYSGRIEAIDRLVVSDASGRLGLEDEFVRCQETGARLLPDEVGVSDYSGREVDERLLVASETGRRGLENESCRCEVSGQRLLLDEVAKCQVTGRLVNRKLLRRSEISGCFALSTELRRCSLTGRVGIKAELVKCAITKEYVIPTQAGRCDLTGLRAKHSELVRSELSGRTVLRKKSCICAKRRIVLAADEMVMCHWNDAPLCPDEAKKCSKTGLTFSKELIDASGAFRVLATLKAGGLELQVRDDLLPWLANQNPEVFRGGALASGLPSKKGRHSFLVVKIERLLGMYEKKVFAVISEKEPRTLLASF